MMAVQKNETNRGHRRSPVRFTRRRVLGSLAAGAAGVGGLALAGRLLNRPAETTGAPLDPGAIPYAWQWPDETKAAVPGGTYRGAVGGDINGTLDPMVSADYTTVDAMSAVYETLLMGNWGPGVAPRSPEATVIRGRLADSYEVTEDVMRFTLRLRPGVKFHDVPPVKGRVMDLDDWKTSYERYVTSSPYKGNLLAAIDKVEYPDSRTIVFTLKEPNVGFLRALAGARSSVLVLPKELNANPEQAKTTAVGTNYKILDKIQPAIERAYRRHPDYWRGPAFIERWHLPVIPEYANAYAQFITGNMFRFGPVPTDVLTVRKDRPAAHMFRGDPGDGFRLNFFGLRDFDTSPWRDERVRIAMRRAVDWNAIRAYFSNSEDLARAGIPIQSKMPTFFGGGGVTGPYWLDPEANELGEVSKNFLFGLTEARALMQAAGFSDGIDIDAFMYGGKEFGTKVYPEVCEITVDQWNKSQLFRAKLKRVTPYADYGWNYYLGRDFKGVSVQQPEYLYGEVDLILFNWYHSRGTRSKWHQSDTLLDDPIMRQRRELDDGRRRAIIHDIQRHMAIRMFAVPGDGNSGGYSFVQPWVHNLAWEDRKWWLSRDAPNRG